MVKQILTETSVDSIIMPENLKVGLMVKEQRKKCQLKGCDDPFYGLAFGQSPFHPPQPLVDALANNAHLAHYSAAEGIPELRTAIAGFNNRHFNL